VYPSKQVRQFLVPAFIHLKQGLVQSPHLFALRPA
jgi:hypothetical protein